MGEGRSEMCRRIVAEFDDARMAIESGLHDPALHAFAPSVYETHVAKPRIDRCIDVVADNRGDVSRRESVEIQFRLDRNPDRFVGHDRQRFTYSAVTTVLIPPRTEKSPTTVIRRG